MTRILVVGGAGVFGRRLAEGLRDIAGVRLVLAGRSLERAQRAVKEIGAGEAIVLDRTTASPEDISSVGADIVIDAAGPFQGADLRFARAVIEAGVTYIDLADARDFVTSFPSLHALARQKNVAAFSGASSTPALTHAVLDRLCAGWRRIDVIRAGIAPATRMERGLAVTKAILSWAGAPVRVFEDGAWRVRSGWFDCGMIDAPMIGRRRYALAETPDLDLMAARFAPRDAALFMAGLELPVMQRGMECIAALHRWGVIQRPVAWAPLLRWLGDMLAPFGSDRGGMIVEVLGRDATDRPAHTRWTMFAPKGLGPYTPTFAALALLRRIVDGHALPPGAQACVGVLTLADFERDFARHGFSTQIDTTPLTSPFEKALGDAFETLAPAVRASHRGGSVTRLQGAAKVEGASSPLGAFVARLFGMPAARDRVAVRVTKRLWPDKDVWTRRFDGTRMESRLRVVRTGVVSEAFGPFTFEMQVSAEEGALKMAVTGWRIGPIPLPSWLAPRSVAIEREGPDGRFHFDVPIALPLIGRVTHYSGWLETESFEVTPTPSPMEHA